MQTEKTGNKFIPLKDNLYVPYGSYKDIENVIKYNKFYSVYLTGPTGCGKTFSIEQACANLNREMIRANITIETDEDDLLGGFRLVNGETKWEDGPVVIAMKRGAVLVLDEVDLAGPKIMCLQPVLEGKSVFLKKINQIVYPAPGFNVFATANTKGKGSEDGRYINTNTQNEALLDRFSITIDQEYPPREVEQGIVGKYFESLNINEEKFVEFLVRWAERTREAFKAEAVDEIISTRRLIHIAQAYKIFDNDKEKAINYCLSRFDDATKHAFMDHYKQIDDEMNPKAPDPSGGPVKEENDDDLIMVDFS